LGPVVLSAYRARLTRAKTLRPVGTWFAAGPAHTSKRPYKNNSVAKKRPAHDAPLHSDSVPAIGAVEDEGDSVEEEEQECDGGGADNVGGSRLHRPYR
jgi:hypothetical protein